MAPPVCSRLHKIVHGDAVEHSPRPDGYRIQNVDDGADHVLRGMARERLQRDGHAPACKAPSVAWVHGIQYDQAGICENHPARVRPDLAITRSAGSHDSSSLITR